MTSSSPQQPQSGLPTQPVQSSLPAQSLQAGAPRPISRWKRIRKFLRRPLVVSIITLILTLGFQWVLGPPSDATVTQLMDQESQIATEHSVEPLTSIYDAQAVITDAGCLTPGQGTVWPGLTQIGDRYSNLGQFTTLQHSDPHISWVPNNFLAMKAYASAITIGGLVSPPGPIRGHEQWIFAKINGQWLITSFTYNLCLP